MTQRRKWVHGMMPMTYSQITDCIMSMYFLFVLFAMVSNVLILIIQPDLTKKPCEHQTNMLQPVYVLQPQTDVKGGVSKRFMISHNTALPLYASIWPSVTTVLTTVVLNDPEMHGISCLILHLIYLTTAFTFDIPSILQRTTTHCTLITLAWPLYSHEWHRLQWNSVLESHLCVDMNLLFLIRIWAIFTPKIWSWWEKCVTSWTNVLASTQMVGSRKMLIKPLSLQRRIYTSSKNSM